MTTGAAIQTATARALPTWASQSSRRVGARNTVCLGRRGTKRGEWTVTVRRARPPDQGPTGCSAKARTILPCSPSPRSGSQGGARSGDRSGSTRHIANARCDTPRSFTSPVCNDCLCTASSARATCMTGGASERVRRRRGPRVPSPSAAGEGGGPSRRYRGLPFRTSAWSRRLSSRNDAGGNRR